MRVTRQHFLMALIAALCLCVLCSCNISETITETVYEQDPQNEVDETKTLLVNTIDAQQTTDALPKLTSESTSEEKQETQEDLPTYGGDISEVAAAMPVEGNEASEEVAESRDSDTEAKGETGTHKGKKKTKKKGKKGKKAKGSGETTPESGAGDGFSEIGDNPDNQGEEQKESGSGKKNEKNEVKVYDDYGEFAEIPEDIKRVTAVGQAAVIVSMLGGSEKETPLLGADEDFVDDADVKRVLAGKGASLVKKVWSGDGSQEGDLADVQDVIDLDPELCFVMEGDDTFTEEQQQALLDESIIVYVLPNMTSASKIRYAVQLVGEILEAGGNERAGELSRHYIEFHDRLVDDIQGRNGGITGGFNYDTGKSVATSATRLHSLYIADWDRDAIYDDANNYIASNFGVGITDVGYEEHPISYYMSVGGAANTAAEGNFRTLSGYTAAVWQFSLTQASCAWGRWESIDRSKVTYALKGNGFDWALLWALSDASGLGTDVFPAVIVKTPEMKEYMEADAALPNGLYYPYPRTESSHGGVIHNFIVGFYSGSNLVQSCIGTSEALGTTSVLNDGTAVEMYDVLVNPRGLFCDWAEGSVESVLEASWIYASFRDKSYDCAADVARFYSDFYDYELNPDELAAILPDLPGPEDEA